MSFNSWQFLIFFPIVVAGYFGLPFRRRWAWLLAASCLFYMAFIPVYILILLVLVVIDYLAAILIERAQGHRRRIFLVVSILSTSAALFVFKYFNFFNANMGGLARLLHWNYPIENLALILPIGLSFHTFQSLNYVFEVYLGHQRAQRHLGLYALYVMFFPQLVAGPIERAGNLLPQFQVKHDFDYRAATDGLKLMLWGFFQKVVIADRLALLVNQVYNNPADYQGLSLIIATVFFAFQIYCDFAGYSDIAIGASQIMGIRLMQNFNRPYFAASIADFWQRWHISLSTWFRDYLYIPLGGNRVGRARWHMNILVTFLLSGLWHGANWTFIVWGGLHGLYYLFSAWTRGAREQMVEAFGLKRFPYLHGILKGLMIFFLVDFAWIFFRANNFGDAGYIVSNLFVGWDRPVIWGEGKSAIGLTMLEFNFAAGLILLLLGVHALQSFLARRFAGQKTGGGIRTLLTAQPIALRWGIYLVSTWVVLNLGVTAEIPFIYFQF